MSRRNRAEEFRVQFHRRDTSVVRWIACASVLLAVGGCAPAADSGDCGENDPCEGRGQMCDLEASECIDIVVDTTNTETPAPANFTDKAAPFHRGTVCFAESVQAGMAVPVALIPCFHSCMTSSTHHHKNYYSCLGSSCDAWASVYYTLDGVDCPADAFGAFPKEMCVFPEPVNLSIGTTIGEGEAVQGTMTLEVPFLTNEDAAIIDAAADDTELELMKMRIEQYPPQDARIVGEIDLRSANPAPPAMCNGAENCTCKEIGF